MKFQDFGFKKFINDALVKIKFEKPTPIQEKVIPILKKYGSVIGLAHTGTGKTHSFLLPLINNLDPEKIKKTQVVIITPTRELARQIFDNAKDILAEQENFNAALYVGGEDINRHIDGLKNRQPNLIVGTPTRIRELYERNALQITTAENFVIDECDMIFDLGFIDDIDFILSKCSKETRISVFSATINNSLRPFLKKYLKGANFVDVSNEKPSSKNVQHVLVWTKNRENKQVLENIVKNINPFLAIIFVNKKEQVPMITGWLGEFGIRNIGELHGDLDARTRTNMQKRIANKEFTWLIATDVAARGIDIDGVSHVISVDLPNDLDYYIHRSGRTGRNNYNGDSYVLFNSQNQFQVDKLKSIGIKFKNMRLQNGELIEIVEKKRVRKQEGPTKTELEIKKVNGQFKNKKVKPGYKKKRKAAIDKIKKDIRREHIKESIRKIKKENYKNRREKYFDDEKE
jgi:ATP-dependent RNA helicase CshB